MPVETISVVIPALDEAGRVGRAVLSAREADEILVVDGGSLDATCAEALAAGARVVQAPACRGIQLDRGAREARGDWLVFLHADTCLEAGWAEALRSLPARVPGGAFRLQIDSERRALRWIEAAVAIRTRLLHLPFGDQALCARRWAYERIGGFRPWPLMEDVRFARSLGRLGPLARLPQRACTSGRRWERRGLWTATMENCWLLALYAAGRSPARLAQAYYGRSAGQGDRQRDADARAQAARPPRRGS
jgi:rSAM/selenodomain-associated transferase 2